MTEPLSGWRRAARLARLGPASVAGAATGRDLAALAEGAADALADLRGLAAKAGQVGAYLDGVIGADVPPGVRKALQRLNDATATSPLEAVQRVVREDLPAEAEAILSTLEPVPVGSGSVAQVHRARLPDGAPVAVKIQHPGIARVITQELASVHGLVRVVGVAMPGVGEVFGEVRDRFLDELDQRKEAAWTRAYAAALADLPGVTVPRVVEAWTSPRVLTTTWEEGLSLDEATVGLDQATRNRAGLALLRAFAASAAAGLVHGDPNAGNYRFRADGEVVLLDMGCMQPVPPDARARLLGALEGPDPALFGALFGPVEGPAGGATTALAEALLAPLSKVGPVAQGDLHTIAHATQAYKVSLARHRASAGPAWAPLTLRTWLGLLAHLHHLGAVLDGPSYRGWVRGLRPTA